MGMQDADYARIVERLFVRSARYLDKLNSMDFEQSETIKDLEAAFVLSAFEMNRVGVVEGLSDDSQTVLREFLSPSTGPSIRVVGVRQFISVTRGSPAFVFSDLGEIEDQALPSDGGAMEASGQN